SQKPGPYVKEMNDAAIFYTNRVLKDYKDSDKRHVDWVKSYLNIWTELQAYIKEHHTTGVAWSKSTVSSVAATECNYKYIVRGTIDAFEDYLEQYHNNPPRFHLMNSCGQADCICCLTSGVSLNTDSAWAEKASCIAQGEESLYPCTWCSLKSFHCFQLFLLGRVWFLEYQDGSNDLVISETELKQVIYIFKCSNSTLQIKGKINSIIVDNCQKLGLIFNNVVGIVEIINSRDVQIQVMGKVPLISINKTEGCHVYLSEESLNCEIVSAKSSEMNILVPLDGDYREFPVPEQFKTIWDGSKLITEPTEIAG
uniref:C-CAP/cofactor C-like domain-containing protein n=1 Tax=Lepisosteus oculatus TaxID=7918 RepID=W5MGU4_LEPOC